MTPTVAVPTLDVRRQAFAELTRSASWSEFKRYNASLLQSLERRERAKAAGDATATAKLTREIDEHQRHVLAFWRRCEAEWSVNAFGPAFTMAMTAAEIAARKLANQ